MLLMEVMYIEVIQVLSKQYHHYILLASSSSHHKHPQRQQLVLKGVANRLAWKRN